MNWDCCRKEENNLSSAFALYETNRTELVNELWFKHWSKAPKAGKVLKEIAQSSMRSQC